MGILADIKKAFSLSTAGDSPVASYFKREMLPIMRSWVPILRSSHEDISEAWLNAAARSVDMYQNSGFVRGAVEVASGAVVGGGLRMASRPDADALGWDKKTAAKFARDFEREFRRWARKPANCDASGQMTFGQLQQALFASYCLHGEGLGFAPMMERNGSDFLTKISLIPPARLVNHTDENEGWYSGVRVDEWGCPNAYKISVFEDGNWTDKDFQANDPDGRPLVFLIKDPIIGSTRNISPLASILKVMRQYDQVFDAVVTQKLTKAVFGAAIKTNVEGISAFDGLFTDKDRTALNVPQFASSKGNWYDGAQVDLSQHGRIAHLFPGDELQFIESKGPGELQDKVNEWLLREFCAGFGITYESGTGDYRGATYSSIRMGGAVEWQTTTRRRENLIIPFCEMAAMMVLEECVGTGRINYPGGYKKFQTQREYASRTAWNGPSRPQADDYKTAKALEVQKTVGIGSLARFEGEYGDDWDDNMRQRAAENELAEELGLPLPWSPQTMLETKEGQEAELEQPNDPRQNNNRNARKTKPGGVRDPGDKRDTGELAADEIEASLDLELEAENVD